MSYLITIENNSKFDWKPKNKSGGRRHPLWYSIDYEYYFCSPRLWNSLPVYIKSSSSVDIFRKRLKTYLFALFSINFCHSSELNALKAFDSPVLDLLGATSEYCQMEDRTIVLTKLRCKNYFSLLIDKLVSEPSAVRAWKKKLSTTSWLGWLFCKYIQVHER